MFKDRNDAGRRLARALAAAHLRNPVVLGLPRGGVPVAAEVARALGAPFDLLMVRKIGVPGQPELAMGAIAEGDPAVTIRNETVIGLAKISAAEFEAERQREVQELQRRQQRYLTGFARPHVSGTTAIIVDDGLATGMTMQAAVAALRGRAPSQIVVAVPVASSEAVADLRPAADEIVTLVETDLFGGVSAFYDDFRQLRDEEVVAALRDLGSRDAQRDRR